MAWVVFDLDNTLIYEVEPGHSVPTEGAVEAVQAFAAEGHRLTVVTSRLGPMPDSERQKLKEEIEQDLQQNGFPPMELWTGTTKPDCDIYISNTAVAYDGDWTLVMAQAQVMLEDAGLALPGMEDGMDPNTVGEEPLPETDDGETIQ